MCACFGSEHENGEFAQEVGVFRADEVHDLLGLEMENSRDLNEPTSDEPSQVW